MGTTRAGESQLTPRVISYLTWHAQRRVSSKGGWKDVGRRGDLFDNFEADHRSFATWDSWYQSWFVIQTFVSIRRSCMFFSDIAIDGIVVLLTVTVV